MRPYVNRWLPFRRTLLRAKVRASDGHTYQVRAVRTGEARESFVIDAAGAVVGAVLPGVGGAIADVALSVATGRVRWGVRVLRRSSWFRRAQLVHAADFATPHESVKRALVLAHRLENPEYGIEHAFERRLAAPPPKRRS